MHRGAQKAADTVKDDLAAVGCAKGPLMLRRLRRGLLNARDGMLMTREWMTCLSVCGILYSERRMSGA
jgi:hypothetical protein